MPAGVDWPTYLKFVAAAMCAMLAGSQVVHVIYKPLQDLDKYVAAERQSKKRILDKSKLNK